MKISPTNTKAQALAAATSKKTGQASQVGAQSSLGMTALPAGAGVPTNASMGMVTTGQTPAERLAHYAEHMEQRLEQLSNQERAFGADLSEVRSDFRHHVARLQAAMGKGLQGDDLARGIENASRLVRDGVRGQLGLVSMAEPVSEQGAGIPTDPSQDFTTLDIDHSNQRLDSIQQRVENRLSEWTNTNSDRDQGVVQNAREQFNAQMVRLRNALGTGNMSQEDMRRSLQNIGEYLSENLQGASNLAGMPSGAHAAQAMPGVASGTTGGTLDSNKGKSLQQVLELFAPDSSASRSKGLQNEVSSLLKPGSPVGDFLMELREATHKAKGGVPEGYTADARLASLIHPDLPGSSLNFKV